MKCNKCGQESGGNFCIYCGAKLNPPIDSQNNEKKEHINEQPQSVKKNTNKPKKKQQQGYKPSIYFRFEWLGAFGAALFLFWTGLILQGIILSILGFFLSPIMVRRYKPWMFYLLLLITVVYVILSAPEWNERLEEHMESKSAATSTDVVQSQNYNSSEAKFDKYWYNKYTYAPNTEYDMTLEIMGSDGFIYVLNDNYITLTCSDSEYTAYGNKYTYPSIENDTTMDLTYYADDHHVSLRSGIHSYDFYPTYH